MANTLLTPTIIAREGLMILENNLVMGNLVSRGQEAEFQARKVGTTITIRTPAAFVVDEFSGTTVVQNATEVGVSLVLEKHFDVSFAVTSQDWTLEVEDFAGQFLEPAFAAIAQGIDNYILTKAVEVSNHLGTGADPPDSIADVLAIDKAMNEEKTPRSPRYGVLDPQAYNDFLTIPEVHNADRRADGGQAIREASAGRFLGIDWFLDQNVQTHTMGTLDDGTDMSALVNGTPAVGALTLNADAVALTGTVVIGDRFTIAGDTEQHAITVGATASGNAITLTFTPALTAAPADNAVITFTNPTLSSYVTNLAFHPAAIALAVVPLDLPRGAANASFMSSRNVGVRVVFDYDNDTQQDVVNIGVLCGAKVKQPELAQVVIG